MSEAPQLSIASELSTTPYRHVRALARGGTADVHVVEHRALGGEMVLKLVRAPDQAIEQVLAKRLLAEGRMLRRLTHPNIVRVLDFGFTNSQRAYMVMELLPGRTLKEEVLRRDGPLSLPEATHVLRQVLLGLQAAHKEGLVHRDLKPDNIFYLDSAEGEPADAPRGVKILDFGIAKITTDDAREALGSAVLATQTGMLLGTPMYATPEQIACGVIDARTDLYALGAVFFFMLAGRAPFLGRSSYEYLEAHLVEAPPAPSSLVPTLPPEVDAFVQKAMQKDPGKRFSSAEAMLAATSPTAWQASPSQFQPARLAQTELIPVPKAATFDADHLTHLSRMAEQTRLSAGSPAFAANGLAASAAENETLYASSPLAKAVSAQRPTEVLASLAPHALGLAEAPLAEPDSTGAMRRRPEPGPYKSTAWTAQPAPEPRRAIAEPSGPRTTSSRRLLLALVVVACALAVLLMARACLALSSNTRSETLPPLRTRDMGMSDDQDVGPKGTFRMASANDALYGDSGVVPSPRAGTREVADILEVAGPATDVGLVPAEVAAFDLASLAEAPAHPFATSDSDPTALGPEPGAMFHGYVVNGLFAEGGFALLYELTHPKTLKRHLVKLLRPKYRVPSQHVIQAKHLVEGKLLVQSAGGNPYLVPAYDVGVDDTFGPYFIMDLLKGRTLHSYILQQHATGVTFEPQSTGRFGVLLASALHSMHSLGVIHRDIKPMNLFIPETRGGSLQVILLDWGAAKTPLSPHSSMEAGAVGTAAYMSPEQIRRGITTGAADQYAIALVLLEMMWRHPFIDDTRGAQELANMNMHVEVAAPPTHLVPPRMFAILKRALQKDYERRYPSCEALAQALRAYLAEPDTLTSAPLVTRVPVRPTIPKDMGAAEQQSARKTQGPPLIVDVPVLCERVDLNAFCERPTLIVVAPQALRGLRYVLREGGVIGRHPAMASIVLDDPSVSSKHAVLTGVITDPTTPVYTLNDLGSTNGTHVAGRQLAPEDIGPLRQGEKAYIGDVSVILMPRGRVIGDLERFENEDLPAPNPESRAQTRRAAADDASLKRGTGARRIPEERDCAGPSLLVLLPKELRGQRFELDERGQIGTDPGRADLVISHPTVSGRHASYESRTDGVVLLDQQSTNGTWRPLDQGFEPVDQVRLVAYARARLGEVEVAMVPAGRVDDRTYRQIASGADHAAARRTQESPVARRIPKTLQDQPAQHEPKPVVANDATLQKPRGGNFWGYALIVLSTLVVLLAAALMLTILHKKGIYRLEGWLP